MDVRPRLAQLPASLALPGAGKVC